MLLLFVLFINNPCYIYSKEGSFLALVDQCSLDMKNAVRCVGFFHLKRYFKPLLKT